MFNHNVEKLNFSKFAFCLTLWSLYSHHEYNKPVMFELHVKHKEIKSMSFFSIE